MADPIGGSFSPEGATKPSSIEHDSFEGDVHALRQMEIPSNMQMDVDYDGAVDGKPLYVGFAPRALADGTNGWLLHKFTYDDSRQVTKREIAYGNWTARASASYA